MIEHVFILKHQVIVTDPLLDRNDLRNLEQVLCYLFLLSTHVKSLFLLFLKNILSLNVHGQRGNPKLICLPHVINSLLNLFLFRHSDVNDLLIQSGSFGTIKPKFNGRSGQVSEQLKFDYFLLSLLMYLTYRTLLLNVKIRQLAEYVLQGFF